MARDVDYYFAQLRKTEAHRSEQAEKEIRKLYKDILQETKQFIAEEYYNLAEDGELTYEILRSHGRDARFLEEVEQKIGGLTQEVSDDIKKTAQEMYELAYSGIQDTVRLGGPKEIKAMVDGLGGATAETIAAVVDNPIATVALERNYKDTIYGVKRDIATGLMVGDRYETMAKRLVKSLDINYKRAVTIARTEAKRAVEAGHLSSAKEVNDALSNGSTEMRLTKTWKTMKDKKVRDTHGPMEGTVVAVDEEFELPSGATTLAPQQSGVASEDINCRCYVSYKLMSDIEFYKITGRHFEGLDVPKGEKIPAYSLDRIEKPVRPRPADYGGLTDEYYAARDAYKAKRAEYDAAIEDHVQKNLSREHRFKSKEEVDEWIARNFTDGYFDKDLYKALTKDGFDIDPRAFDDFAEVTEEMIRKFPDMMSEGLTIGYSVNDAFMEAGGGIYFNKRVFSNYADALRDAAENRGTRDWVYGDGTIRTVMFHEYGHNVESWIKYSILDSTKARVAMEDDLVKSVFGKKGMSEYATTNAGELFAEGFAAYITGEKSEFAKEFGKFLGRWLKK